MNNQKTGNTLNLALDATSREREASMNLNAGYEKAGARPCPFVSLWWA